MILPIQTVHYCYTQLDDNNILKSLEEVLEKNLSFTSKDTLRFSLINFPLRKIQFVASRLLIEHMNQKINKKMITSTLVEKDDTNLSLCFPRVWSITHSKNYVAVATGNIKLLGIDSEYKNPNRPFAKIASRVFQENVYQELLDNKMDHQKQSFFYQCWSEKEARYKAGFKADERAFIIHWQDKKYAHCCASSCPIKLIQKKIAWEDLIQLL